MLSTACIHHFSTFIFFAKMLAVFGLMLTVSIEPKDTSEAKETVDRAKQCLSQDFKTGCLKLAVVKFGGVQIFKGYHNILIFQP